MAFHFRRRTKIGPWLEGPRAIAERTPPTPIRQGRSTPGGMIAVFILIGFVVVAIALFGV